MRVNRRGIAVMDVRMTRPVIRQVWYQQLNTIRYTL